VYASTNRSGRKKNAGWRRPLPGTPERLGMEREEALFVKNAERTCGLLLFVLTSSIFNRICSNEAVHFLFF
jgi:hypothetical protein